MVSLLQQMMVPSLQQMGPFVATTTETRFSLGRRQQVLFWGLCEIWASIGSSPTLGQLEPSILKLNSLEQIQGACLFVVMATMLCRRNSGSFTQSLKLQRLAESEFTPTCCFSAKRRVFPPRIELKSVTRGPQICVQNVHNNSEQKRVGLELPFRRFAYCTTQVVLGCLPLAFLFLVLQCCFIQPVFLTLHNKPITLVPSFSMFFPLIFLMGFDFYTF